jgi:hypothetical protein
MRTSVVGGREGADHELSRLDGFDGAADFFDNAAVLVAHRRRTVNRLQAPVRPQVRSADAGRRKPQDRVGGFDNLGVIAVLKPNVTRSVKNCAVHVVSCLSSIPLKFHISYPGFL